MSVANIDDPVIAICIKEQFPYCENEAFTTLYACTRGLWHVNLNRAQKAVYAFAVYEGVVREVYVVTGWEPATQERKDFWVARKAAQGDPIDPAINDGRYDFIGHVAPDQIRNKYRHKLMPESFYGPLRYFNCPED